MRRRDWFLAAAAVGAAPLLYAQPAPRVRRIALLSSSGEASMVPFVGALWAGLREFGYEEGKNMTLEARYAAGDLSRLPQLAREIVALNPEAIVSPADAAAVELRKLTTTVPIVLVLSSDAVGAGLAKSLGRPGGNVTGFSVVGSELNAKRIELIKAALPKLARLGVLYADDAFGKTQLAGLRAPAAAAGVQFVTHPVRSEEELGAAVEAAARASDALLFLPSPFMFTNRKRVIDIVRTKQIPALYSENVFAHDGGLMAFSADFLDRFRLAAGYVHRILQGAKPADLPIQEPIKFEFVVNLRTAREQGLKLPQSLLQRADRVIE